VSAEAGDSAGAPWAGRTLTGQPFAGDDGSTDPGLLAALAEWSAARDAAPLAEVVRAWAPTRVLVPIVAVLGEGEDVRSAAEHGQGDKSADMALVTITGRDGRRILPAFSSTVALAAWNDSARPVPVEAARAAQAAVVEGCDAIAIDPAGPIACLLPRPAVWAVAQGRRWRPPAEDPEMLAAVEAIATSVPGLVAHRLESDGVAGLNVVLGLPPGLPQEQVQQVAGRMSQLLAADQLIAERADSLRLTVRPV
jgi:SseB protein N-terminal domain